jgi:arginase
MNNKTLNIIGCQMDLGANRRGVDLGPVALRYTGLIDRLRDQGFTVADRGDIIPIDLPDDNPRMKHLRSINEANGRLYALVSQAFSEGAFPITIGGDHSVASASVAAVRRGIGDIGVIWVESNGDFNNE